MFFMKKRMRQDLERLFNDNALGLTHCAHIAVDVQDPFCGYFNAITNRITQTVAPAFDKIAISTFWMYMGNGECLHKSVTVAPGDHPMRKEGWSSFYCTTLDADLRAQDKKILFIDGFCAGMGGCVDATAQAAREHGYHTILLTDCMEKPEWKWANKMRKDNVHLVSSGVAMHFLYDLQTCQNSSPQSPRII